MGLFPWIACRALRKPIRAVFCAKKEITIIMWGRSKRQLGPQRPLIYESMPLPPCSPGYLDSFVLTIASDLSVRTVALPRRRPVAHARSPLRLRNNPGCHLCSDYRVDADGAGITDPAGRPVGTDLFSYWTVSVMLHMMTSARFIYQGRWRHWNSPWCRMRTPSSVLDSTRRSGCCTSIRYRFSLISGPWRSGRPRESPSI
jgi:hypothetical protein